MVQQPIKVWICRKKEPYQDFFITENPKYVRDARKMGFKCVRWKKLEQEKNRTK